MYETRSKEYQAKKQAYEELNRALVKENNAKLEKGKHGEPKRTAALAAISWSIAIPPQLPRLTSSDTTVEGLHRAMKKGYRVRALISGDAGTLLGGYSMRENLIYTLSKFSDVWSTGEFDRDRSSSDEDPERLYNVRLNIHWMVQPEIAREFIGSKIANEQGFLPRVLPVYPEPRFGKRGGLERYKATEDVDIKAWHTDTEKLAHPDNWSYALDDEDHQYPIRVTLRVTDAALAELDPFFREMEKRGERRYGSRAYQIVRGAGMRKRPSGRRGFHRN